MGVHPKRVSGFLWGNPHEEDRGCPWEKGQLSVGKNFIAVVGLSPAIETVNISKLFRDMLSVAHPNAPVQPMPHLVQAPRPRLDLWSLMDAIAQRVPESSQVGYLEG